MYMYGGPQAAAFFERANGLSLADFVLAGFATWATFLHHPVIAAPLHLAELGLTTEKYQRALVKLSMPLEDMRRLTAREHRGYPQGVAYRPSILRRYPCVSFDGGRRLRAPLIDLIMSRVNSGLYYDLVGDGGARNEFQNRFTDYSRELLATTFPEVQWRPESKYGPKKQRMDTPDILMGPQDRCRLVIECKANKMRAAALFGEDAMLAAKEGFEYIAKGVEQLWRYFSHVRRGLVPNHGLADDVFGVVLTLDPWLRVSRGRYTALMALAGSLADARGGIEPQDRKSVAFASIDDFEELLGMASLRFRFWQHCETWQTRTTLAISCGTGMHSLLRPPPVERAYPFEERAAEFLPWWQTLDDIRDGARGRGGAD